MSYIKENALQRLKYFLCSLVCYSNGYDFFSKLPVVNQQE